MASQDDVEKQQASINLAILYLTVMIVIGTVVIEWPPDAQNTPEFLTPIVFYGGGFVGVYAFLRVLSLIYKLEKENFDFL